MTKEACVSTRAERVAQTKKGVRDFMAWRDSVQDGLSFVEDHCTFQSPADTMKCDATPPSGVTIEWHRETMRKWREGPKTPRESNIKCMNVDQDVFGPAGLIVNSPPNPKQWPGILALPDTP